MKKIDIESIRDSLPKSIKKMTALEMLILYLKIEKNFTLKEIGAKLCISYEMVRQHLKKIYSIIKRDVDLNNANLSK